MVAVVACSLVSPWFAVAVHGKSPTPQQSTQSVSIPLPGRFPAIVSEPSSNLALSAEHWSPSEIQDAKRVCQDALKEVSAVVEHLPPIRTGNCGAPAPVRLLSLGRAHPVNFNPPAIMSCNLLPRLKLWIETGLQPAAERYLDTRVTDVLVMSSYSCRTRYGHQDARMSEHAFANALDIGGFEFADKRRVSVLDDWGTTRRDILQAAAKEKTLESSPKITSTVEAAKPQAGNPASTTIKEKAAVSQPIRKAPKSSKIAGITNFSRSEGAHFQTQSPLPTLYNPLDGNELRQSLGIPPLPERRPLRRAVRSTVGQTGAVRSRDAARKDAKTLDRRFHPEEPMRLGGPRAPETAPLGLFLRAAHASACRLFGTTLGPEANEAHRNHFHIDMLPRRHRGYCE